MDTEDVLDRMYWRMIRDGYSDSTAAARRNALERIEDDVERETAICLDLHRRGWGDLVGEPGPAEVWREIDQPETVYA
jgi:hypothetical protein